MLQVPIPSYLACGSVPDVVSCSQLVVMCMHVLLSAKNCFFLSHSSFLDLLHFSSSSPPSASRRGSANKYAAAAAALFCMPRFIWMLFVRKRQKKERERERERRQQEDWNKRSKRINSLTDVVRIHKHMCMCVARKGCLLWELGPSSSLFFIRLHTIVCTVYGYSE